MVKLIIQRKDKGKFFCIILHNPKISRKQLSEKLGINESAVQKNIAALKKKNMIERDSATTGQWIIKVKNSFLLD